MTASPRDANRDVAIGAKSDLANTYVPLECNPSTGALFVETQDFLTPDGDSMVNDTSDALQVALVTGDIEIGAVEIKDHDGSDRTAVNSSNELQVRDDDANTDLDTLAGAVSGNEMQVDIVADGAGLMTSSDFTTVFGSSDIVSATPALQVEEQGTVTVDLDTNNDVTIDNSSIVHAEDAAHSSGDAGTLSLAVRQDDIDKLTSADGDYAPFKTNRHGSLYTDPQAFHVIDKMNAATGWSVLGNDTINLATSTNHVCGTNSLEFDKVDGADNTVFAGIEKTLTSFKAGPYLKAGGFILYSLYVSSTTEVDYAFVRLGTDSSNYNEWRISGDVLVTGWNNIRIPILSPEASGITGSGWDCSAVTYGAVGVAFDAQNDTLADIRIDRLTLNAGMQTSADITAQISSEVSSPNVRVTKWGNDNVDTNTGNVGDGTLRVTVADDDTNLNTIAGAVTGSEMQVDIVADGAGLLTSTDFNNAFGIAGTADSQVLSVQGITSMTPLLVDATGQGDVPVTLDNEEVTNAAFGSIYNGQNTVASAGTAEVLASSQAIKSVTIKALSGNSGIIYVGDSSVSSSNGYALAAGEGISMDVNNLNVPYIDAASTGDGVSYMAIG